MAFSLGIILAGFPITIELLGISIFTYDSGAISTLLPMLIFPTITALAPIQTLSPIVGHPAFLPLLVFPIVTPWAMLTLLPIVDP